MEANRDVCDCNHTGSSGAMETEGAKILWKRSVAVGSFQYTALLGDGDAAVMDSLNAIEPYPGVTLTKEECINHMANRMYKGLEKIVKDVNGVTLTKEECITHVANRMYKGLEKIVKDVNAEVKQNKAVCVAGRKNADVTTRQAINLQTTSLWGRGHMTNDCMKKWSYFRKAIVENAQCGGCPSCCVGHLSQRDDPHHTFCSDRWSFWKQAEREGVNPTVRHAAVKHDVPLTKYVSERLIPLFQCLASADLLRRCMQLQTLNANECLHSTVWRMAPKSKYCGRKTVEIAVALAVIQYNKGLLHWSMW